MPTPTEYWEVNYVQYYPNQEQVQLAGYYTIVGATGKKVAQYENVMTTQTALMSHAPVGATTWGDDEVIAEVTAQLGIPCVMYAAPQE